MFGDGCFAFFLRLGTCRPCVAWKGRGRGVAWESGGLTGWFLGWLGASELLEFFGLVGSVVGSWLVELGLLVSGAFSFFLWGVMQ